MEINKIQLVDVSEVMEMECLYKDCHECPYWDAETQECNGNL